MIDCGIKIRTNTQKGIVENKKITKILTNNEDINNIDLVVCNADPPMVYSKLLKKQNLRRPVLREKNLLYSMVFLYFSLEQKNNITLHIILFG